MRDRRLVARERESEREVRSGVTGCWRVRRAVIAAVVFGFEVRWGRRGVLGGEFLDLAKAEARVSCK